MPKHEWNKETAAEAGAKGKRGKAKLPYELKMVLNEGSMDRVPNLWKAIDELEGGDPAVYLNYLLKILALVIPKDLNVEGEISVSANDARDRLIERLASKIGSPDSESDTKKLAK